MKQTFRSLAALVLCLSLCLSLALPVFALSESNSEGITFAATLDKTTLTVSDQPQTVVMTVSASQPVSLDGIGASVVYDSELVLTAIENTTDAIDFAGSADISTAAIAWSAAPVTLMEHVTNIAVVTFTVPANTPAGTYEVGLKNIELTRNFGRAVFENTASASAVLTVQAAEGTEPPAAEGYSAGLRTSYTDPYVKDTVTADILVNHSEDQKFAAGQMEIAYDTSRLTFVSAVSKEQTELKVTEKDGIVTLADHGSDKSFGSAYTLTFTAKAEGQATVTLNSAAFIDKEGAEDKDLLPAVIAESQKSVTMNIAHSVTLPEGFTGAPTVEYGGSYTFSANNPSNNYTFTATADGQSLTVTDNQNGTYTVSNVTGNLVITLTGTTHKTFSVSITEGTTSANDGSRATYMTDYAFTLKDKVDAFTDNGTQYVLKSITIGGKAFTNYSTQGLTYTIPGESITGDILIVIEAKTLPSTHYTVSVNGDLSEIGSNYASSVEKGASYTLSFTQIKGFHYTVTAKMGDGEEFEVTGVLNESTNQYDYTISSVTGTLVFTVSRYADMGLVTVDKYLTSNGADVYIILKKTELEDSWKPVYESDGEQKDMFWSDKYGAYCYLVFDNQPNLDAYKTHIKLVEGKAPVLDYSKDVNLSRHVDAADAQLVYNMYNAMYTDFSDTVTMEKFLLADVVTAGNEAPTVDVNDAVAIINAILSSQAAAE